MSGFILHISCNASCSASSQFFGTVGQHACPGRRQIASTRMDKLFPCFQKGFTQQFGQAGGMGLLVCNVAELAGNFGIPSRSAARHAKYAAILGCAVKASAQAVNQAFFQPLATPKRCSSAQTRHPAVPQNLSAGTLHTGQISGGCGPSCTYPHLAHPFHKGKTLLFRWRSSLLPPNRKQVRATRHAS